MKGEGVPQAGDAQVDVVPIQANGITIIRAIIRHDGDNRGLMLGGQLKAELGPDGVVYIEEQDSRIIGRLKVDGDMCAQGKLCMGEKEQPWRIVLDTLALRVTKEISCAR